MSKGTQTGAWAPSMANQTPLSRARRRSPAPGKSCPVVHVTWLTRIEARPRVDEAADPFDVARRAREVGLEQADHDAVALHPVEQADVDGHVLVRRRDHLVALLQGQPVDDGVDALGRAADQGQVFLPAGGAEQAREALLDAPPQRLVVAGVRRPLLGARPLPQAVEHGHGAGAKAAEVQVRPGGVEDELVADELPEGGVAGRGRVLERGAEIGCARGSWHGQAAHHRRHALEEFLPVHACTSCDRHAIPSAVGLRGFRAESLTVPRPGYTFGRPVPVNALGRRFPWTSRSSSRSASPSASPRT